MLYLCDKRVVFILSALFFHHQGIELVPVLTEENGRPELQLVVKNSDGQTLVHESISTRPQQARSFDPRKKRAGRPRKGMDRLLPPESKTPIKEEKPTEPVKGMVPCFRHFSQHPYVTTYVWLRQVDLLLDTALTG